MVMSSHYKSLLLFLARLRKKILIYIFMIYNQKQIQFDVNRIMVPSEGKQTLNQVVYII